MRGGEYIAHWELLLSTCAGARSRRRVACNLRKNRAKVMLMKLMGDALGVTGSLQDSCRGNSFMRYAMRAMRC
jgi:hypothetical protein